MARRIISPKTQSQNITGVLENLSASGTPPSSRLNSPQRAKNLCDRMIDAGEKRNANDAAIYGMVSGRPPYSDVELEKNGQLWRANVNWGIGKAFLEVALTQYWDIITSCPSYCTVTLDLNGAEQQDEWSKIVSEEFDRLNRADRDLLYMFQLSQHNMVLYRYGPVVWFHPTDFRATAIPQEDLFVMDNTKSNVGLWEACCIRMPYAVHQLYGEIRDGKAAAQAGWHVPAVKDCIMRAMPDDKTRGRGGNWMAYEQRLANNDLYETSIAETVLVYWLLWREFPTKEYPEGAISMAAVSGDDSTQDWLYLHPNRYRDWRQCIGAFYFDNGDGTHHSVKGLGQKMFPALSMYDRLQCHAVDTSMTATSYHWRATTPENAEGLSIMPMGPHMIYGQGLEYIQTTPMGQALDSLVGMKQDLLFNLTNNLALYRQQRGAKKGNPPTAFEVQTEVENTSIIGKSQLTRYFEQLDDFWTERYRRVANPAQSAGLPGGREAIEFQRRCVQRGVPSPVLQAVGSVRATRTIGYGNAGARNLAYSKLMSMIALFNEAGRQNLLEDVVNAEVGQTLMRRYVPLAPLTPEQMDQKAEARQSVASMKVGVPPLMTPHQNPVIYANEYLEAASGAVASLEQGADPQGVYNFLSLCGPAILAYLQQIAKDPTRKQVYDKLLALYKELQQVYHSLEAQLRQSMQRKIKEQQQLAQQQQAQLSEQALKAQQMQADMQMKAAKQQHAMGLKQQKTEQDMALADARTAADIHLQKQQTDAQVELDKQKAKTAKKANNE